MCAVDSFSISNPVMVTISMVTCDIMYSLFLWVCNHKFYFQFSKGTEPAWQLIWSNTLKILAEEATKSKGGHFARLK